MKKSSYDGRSRSVDRSSGQQQFGSARKRTSSVDRLSIYGRQSSSGRQSVAPLRIRNEGNHHQLPKAKNPRTSYDSRGSFGWKGPSTASGMGSRKTPQKNSRSSFYSRQSAMGLSSHNGIPKDPRKLHDRGVQQRFITNVYEFLTENGYSHQITPKILASPTTKDFLKIFEFIYGQFEPKFKLGKKPEEEVPVLLKSLRYPFLISKSSIFAVGTSHTWPSVLAALDWMVNLIKFQKNVCVDDVIFLSNDGDFDEIPESRIKFDYIEKTYEAFLDGHDTFEEHDAKLAQTLNHKYYGVHGSVEGLAEEAKRLEIERDSLMKDVERLKVQQVKLAASVSDEQTYSQFVENLSSHEKTLQGQFSILQEECLALRLEHEEIHSKIQQMQQIYQRQELTPADINRINLERQELRRKKECAEKQIAEYDEEIWNYEKEMAKALEKVENKCSEYNKKARKLNLIPSTAENAFGVDYELSSSLSSYLSSAKVQETIKPALSELKKRISESIQQKEIEKIEKMNSVEQIEEHNDELRTQIAMDVAKVKRMDEEYDAKKQMYQREYQKSQETIDFLQKKIWEMRGASQQSVAEIEQDLWETAEMGRQKLEQKVNERKQYDQFLDTVNKSVIDHRIAISVHIEKMYNEGKATLEKLEKESEQLRKL